MTTRREDVVAKRAVQARKAAAPPMMAAMPGRMVFIGAAAAAVDPFPVVVGNKIVEYPYLISRVVAAASFAIRAEAVVVM